MPRRRQLFIGLCTALTAATLVSRLVGWTPRRSDGPLVQLPLPLTPLGEETAVAEAVAAYFGLPTDVLTECNSHSHHHSVRGSAPASFRALEAAAVAAHLAAAQRVCRGARANASEALQHCCRVTQRAKAVLQLPSDCGHVFPPFLLATSGAAQPPPLLCVLAALPAHAAAAASLLPPLLYIDATSSFMLLSSRLMSYPLAALLERAGSGSTSPVDTLRRELRRHGENAVVAASDLVDLTDYVRKLLAVEIEETTPLASRAPCSSAASPVRVAFLGVYTSWERQREWQAYLEAPSLGLLPPALFVIHTKRTRSPSSASPPLEFPSLPSITSLPDTYGSDYGGLGYVRSLLQLLRVALDDARAFTHFVVVSGADVPLTSYTAFARALATAGLATSWVHLSQPRGRYETQVLRYRLSVMNGSAWAHSTDAIESGLPPKHPAQGLVFARPLAGSLLEADAALLGAACTAPHPGACGTYPTSSGIDELWVPLLAGVCPRDVLDRSATHFNWDGGGGGMKRPGSPHTYTNLTAGQVSALRAKGVFFARKVDRDTNLPQGLLEGGEEEEEAAVPSLPLHWPWCSTP